MAADARDPGAPVLNLSQDEKRLYGQLFRQADTDNVGVVTGEVAVQFFEKTRLNSRVLGEIWQIADRENRGFLTPAGFGVVLRLIGHAQAGQEPTPELALQQAPLPRFDGIPTQPTGSSPGPGPISSPPPPAALQAQGTGGPIRIPPLTPEKVTQYSGLFERQPLQGGLLPGEQARQIFEKSGLPNEMLGRIWQLVDVEQRGSLNLTEFAIAMHLLTSMKSGALRALPSILPPGLFEAASRRPGAPRQSPTATGGPTAIPRQLSGTAQVRIASPLGRPPMSPTAGVDDEWLVTPADKARFDQLYNDLDKTNKGFITGEEAVTFFGQSKLPEDSLAQVWDLADSNSVGYLTRDQFAVAMYLIRQQRTNPNVPLPSALPANLLPPSLRAPALQAAAPTSAFDAPPPAAAPVPPPQPKSALDDLFGMDASPPAPPAAPVTAPLQTTMSTGGSNANDPFAGGSSVLTPSSPNKAFPASSTFKPFVPSSSFGRGLSAQPAGSSAGKPAADAHEDLLMDNDPDGGKNISGETTELANLSNQVGSLSKQMQDVQAKRTTTQNELTQATSQKQNFEQRLAQLRTLYEKEAQDSRALEEQLSTARSDTKKLQAECMTLEGQYQDIQAQHQQFLASLQADQQENTTLRERIRVVNAEIAQLKPQIEKLKSEARQQKGLAAINKKQLSTTEGERDKLKTEAEDLTKSNEDLSRQANTSSPASGSGQVASPAASTSSGNNPFFKRTASTDIMGAFGTPPAKNVSDKAFDDVFGPSVPASSSGTPPPPTSFKPQNTGASSTSVGSYATPPASSPVMSRQATLANDPPAPPESRQISSSFLPFPAHNDSLSSSRQVSPPGSRVGDATDPAPDSLPGAFPSVEAEKPVAKDSPEEETPKATPEDALPAPADKSDPFGGTDEAKAKADFEDAFAAFTNGKSQSKSGPEVDKSTSAFSTEFPPISELDIHDDESDSSSEGGFDNDFVVDGGPSEKPSTDGGAPLGNTEQTDPESTTATPATAHEIPPATEAKETSEPVSSPPPAAAAAVAETAPQTSAVDDIFGAAATGAAPEVKPSVPSAAPSNPPAAAKPSNAFDDLDDEFEGLEDAKEGSEADDFANISRSGMDDFNAVFDSSPPASQAKSESTAFGNDSSFDFVSASSTGAVPVSQQKPAGAAGAGAGAGAGAAPAAPADSHDWDAIFSSLDTPVGTAITVPAPAAPADAATPTESAPAAATDPFPNDDPILKNLTAMGYDRKLALETLEKYDYNLDRAANHLANQS